MSRGGGALGVVVAAAALKGTRDPKLVATRQSARHTDRNFIVTDIGT